MLKYPGQVHEFCDHTMANKNHQVRRFNPGMDPKRLGWFDWQVLETGTMEIDLISDETVEFYGFDMHWECNEFLTTAKTTTDVTTTTMPMQNFARAGKAWQKSCRILS